MFSVYVCIYKLKVHLLNFFKTFVVSVFCITPNFAKGFGTVLKTQSQEILTKVFFEFKVILCRNYSGLAVKLYIKSILSVY